MDSSGSPIPRRSFASEAPASYGQERLWFVDQFENAKSVYNRPANLRFFGALNIDALRRSLDEIIRRHASLRTRFQAVDGRPTQQIQDELSLPLPITDMSDCSPTECEAQARQMAVDEACRPFDLARGPLVRARLLRMSRDDHILLFTIHHIVFDGWSEGILFDELALLYAAFAANQPSPLEPLPIQYADFALWQRERLQGATLEKLVSYWQTQLQHRTHALNLPTDRPRPAFQSYTGARHSFEISKDLADALIRLGRSEQATLFMTLLAAFHCLLHRYTDQEDILIGCPVAGRGELDTERLIGFFVNVLVIGAEFSEGSTFRQILQALRRTTIAAFAHQDLPFEKLIAELGVDRDHSRSPLFQVLFQLRNYPRPKLNFPGLRVTPYAVGSGLEKCDLNVEFIANDSRGLECSMRYNTDLFHASTIVEMGKCFGVFLERVVAAPDQRVALVPLLDRRQRHRALVEWNDTKQDYPINQCVHAIFEKQAKKTPDAVAVVFEKTQLTYQQLDARADELARCLRREGVQTEAIVGICIERSLEMVVGLLGILKAGAAYLPLDPAYPAERLAFMVEDSRISMLLTQQALAAKISGYGGKIICLDAEGSASAGEPRIHRAPPTRSDNLAYVMYTSGSTGRPKGASITHRGVMRLVTGIPDVRPGADEVFLQFAPISFDASTFEIWGCLLQGAKLIIFPPDPPSLHELATFITDHGVTTLWLTAALFHQMVDDHLPSLAQVRRLLSGGDVLSVPRVRRVIQALGDGRFVNGYGPTENTTFTCCHVMTSASNMDGAVPIGRPIANTQVFILDRQMQPVPIGMAGEIYIGGDGLARDYWRRPELTAENFIPNPFGDAPGARLYKTGDLARYLPDGNIEFLKRRDHQAKIRGFRIEPAEIEFMLNRHPGVQDSAVIAREDKSGEKHLVAYIVAKKQTESAMDLEWAELQDRQIADWESLFEDTFNEAPDPEDPATNTAGVNSSYTNAPVPAEQSREWVDHAANRVLSLKPQRVLDIGCGLGRTLFRVAPYCSRYWGTDFSQVALNYVEQHLDLLGSKRAEIKLIRARAENFSSIPDRHFDTVVINGVVQYFPHLAHLVKVLDGALNALDAQGVVFIGDVRSLPLLEAFQLSVDLYQSPEDLPADHLWQRVKRNIEQDEELVIDPGFFKALPSLKGNIGSVDVLIKRGRSPSEMTRFRYDAIIYKDGEVSQRLPQDIPWLDWDAEKLTLGLIRERLVDQPAAFGIVGVPNARVFPEVSVAAALARGEHDTSVRKLRDRMEAMRVHALDPEDFWALQDEFSCSIELTWSQSHGPGCFDVFIQPRGAPDDKRRRLPFPENPAGLESLRSYAHNPTQVKMRRALRSSVHSFLKKTLPAYMVPASLTFLESLPFTPAGKLDRRALAVADLMRSESDKIFAAPRSIIEKGVAGIWSNILGLERVGIDDNFFDLGGHSLLATQVVSRVSKIFHVDLPLRALFEHPSIESLAKVIAELAAKKTEVDQALDLLANIESLSDDDVNRLLTKK